MQESELKELIDRCLKGIASAEEQRRLDDWYDSFDSKQGMTEQLQEDEQRELREKMFSRIKGSLQEHKVNEVKQLPFYQRHKVLMIAASVITIVVCWYLYSLVASPAKQNDFSAMAVVSGEDGIILKKALPDGSVIWLNGKSTLRYDSITFAESRKVSLQGEAYFDIAPDTQHPFTVESAGIITSVIGTAFNIRATDDASVVLVTVAEGKVAVNSKQKKLGLLLPGDQLEYNNSTEVLIQRKVNPSKYTSWKKGSLYFRERTFSDIASIFKKRYNIQIEFGSPSPQDCQLTASFDSTNQVKDMLSMLCKINGSTLTVKNDRYVISGTACR